MKVCSQTLHDKYKKSEQSFRQLSDIKHQRDNDEGINMLYGNCPDCGSTLCYDFDRCMAYVFWDGTISVYGMETDSCQRVIDDPDDVAVLDAIPGRGEWITYRQLEQLRGLAGGSDIKLSDRAGKFWRIKFSGESVRISEYGGSDDPSTLSGGFTLFGMETGSGFIYRAKVSSGPIASSAEFDNRPDARSWIDRKIKGILNDG